MRNANKAIFNFLIYDEMDVIRNGIEKIISDSFNSSNVIVAKNMDEVLELSKILKFDLHIIGCNTIFSNEFLNIRKIKQAQMSSKILVLSLIPDVIFMNKCIYNGALGFVTKTLSAQDMIMAITVSLKENAFFSNDIKLKLAFKNRKKEALKNLKGINKKLSKREFQLAQMLINGEKNSDISKKLKLAMSTISTYKRRVMIKTNTTNVLELAEILRYNDPVKLLKKY